VGGTKRERSLAASEQGARWYQYAVGVIIFLLGLIARLIGAAHSGFLWSALSDLGTFLSLAVSVTFVYDRFVRQMDHKSFLNDLDNRLRAILAEDKDMVSVRQQGRPELSEQLSTIFSAQREILEIGVSLRTFSSYFHQRPDAQFRSKIVRLLRGGVVLRCCLLDPDSEAAQFLERTGADVGLVARLHASLSALAEIKREFESESLSGRIEIRLYSARPTFFALVVDGDLANGQMRIAHYLPGVTRADSPQLEFSRLRNPTMFEIYMKSITATLKDSREA